MFFGELHFLLSEVKGVSESSVIHRSHFLLVALEFHLGLLFLLSFGLFLLPFDFVGLVLKLLDLSSNLTLPLNGNSKHTVSFPLKTKLESIFFLPSLNFLLAYCLSFNALLLFFFEEVNILSVKSAFCLWLE